MILHWLGLLLMTFELLRIVLNNPWLESAFRVLLLLDLSFSLHKFILLVLLPFLAPLLHRLALLQWQLLWIVLIVGLLSITQP